MDSTAATAEDTILYAAERLDFEVDEEVLQLRRSAWIRSGIYQLFADSMQVEIDRELLTAVGEAVLEDGEGRLIGDSVVLDLRSERGTVAAGVTAMEDGIYQGRTIRRVGTEHLDVDQGIFSTCRLEHPHYSFTCDAMRIEEQELAVARPLVVRVREVPVFYLPYFALSQRKGRHSGILVPSLEKDSQAGRFFRDVGYYWAPNDHFDWLASADLYRTGRFRFESTVRAAWRYSAPASSVRWIQDHNPESGRESTDLRLAHAQNFDNGLRLRLDSSASRISRSSGGLQRNWSGSAVMSKTLEGLGSATATLRSTRDLESGRVIEQLPTLTFRSQWWQFFPEDEDEGPWRNSADSLVALEGPAWYQALGLSYSGTASSERNRNAGSAISHAAIDHRWTLSARGLRLPAGLSFAPSVVFQESWFDRRRDRLSDRIVTGWTARHSFQASAGLSTTVQGIYRPKLGPLRGVLHSIDPRLTVFYTPNFEQYFQDVNGSSQDIFSGLGSSATPAERRSFSYSLSNALQIKWAGADGGEERIDLLSVQLSGSYDHLRDLRADLPGPQHFSNLGLSGRLAPTDELALRLSLPYDPYRQERGTMSITADGRWSGSDDPAAEPTPPLESSPIEADLSERQRIFADDPHANLSTAPWSASAHGTWTIPREAPSTMRVSGNLGFHPTPKWRLDYRSSFNLTSGERESQYLTVRRDLHCWTGSFSWRESSGVWSYYLVLRAKDLSDLKLENREFGVFD